MTSSVADKEKSPANLVDRALQAGITAARQGKKGLARRLLHKVTELDPVREEAWLWLASVASDSKEAHAYLETVLALNPNNRQAREGLRWVERQLPDEPAGAVCPLCDSPVPADAVRCPVCRHILVEETELSDAEAAELSRPRGELAPSFIISVEQAEAIDACLAKMADDSQARGIILADVTGQQIAEWGRMGGINTQVLSALAAGELAATHEMARLVGERARFKLLLHEGEKQSVYLSDVGEQLILVIVFDNETPIGLVRTVLKRALEELAPILLQPPGHDAGSQQGSGVLDDDFARLVESELNSSLEL
jgi:predicted regulator of Ras-like GTPase activity (Roadblock/LC7/MglB family)